MLKIGSSKKIGTPVRCPNCRHPNLAIDIWCERCGRPLDWKPTLAMPDALEAPEAPEAPEPPEPPETQPRTATQERRPATLPEAGRRQYCWSCGAPNGADDQFCGECGKPLGAVAATVASRNIRRRRKAAAWTFPRLSLPAIAVPRLSAPELRLPQWRLPQWRLPQWRPPRISLPGLRPPLVPRTVLVVAVVLVALLIIPIAYLLFPAHGSVASRSPAATHLAKTNGTAVKAGSLQAVAIAAVEAKTGLKYSGFCRGSNPCLSISGQTLGQGAAAVVFSTAPVGGRQCVSYLVQQAGGWQLLDSVLCALPGQVSPLLGHDATVHVPGNCANVRDSASLQGRVVGCLYDGTTVHVDGGPTYADALVWWHTSKGWIAHQFLVAP